MMIHPRVILHGIGSLLTKRCTEVRQGAIALQRSAMHDRRGEYLGLMFFVWVSVLATGCHPLRPKRIPIAQPNPAPKLAVMNTPQVEWGKPRPVLDGVGWVVGIPSKLLLWNRKIDNHRLSAETEAVLQSYLADNELVDVKVRMNQYRPLDDWRRLTANQSVAWPWRYTFGAVSVLGETLLPGRVFGGDHFNPYTNTIHLYSDVPVIALHEAAHAKDFRRRTYPGTYAALYTLPIVPLYHESIASADVMAYLEALGDEDLHRQAYHTLYPAYGTYVGGAMGVVFPPASVPLYYGSVVGGHLAGRWESRRISATPQELSSEPQHAELSSQLR